MNLAWLLFYGRKLNMRRQEIMCTRYGEMLDMIACLAIYNGAKAKKKQKHWTFDAAMKVR